MVFAPAPATVDHELLTFAQGNASLVITDAADPINTCDLPSDAQSRKRTGVANFGLVFENSASQKQPGTIATIPVTLHIVGVTVADLCRVGDLCRAAQSLSSNSRLARSTWATAGLVRCYDCGTAATDRHF